MIIGFVTTQSAHGYVSTSRITRSKPAYARGLKIGYGVAQVQRRHASNRKQIHGWKPVSLAIKDDCRYAGGETIPSVPVMTASNCMF